MLKRAAALAAIGTLLFSAAAGAQTELDRDLNAAVRYWGTTVPCLQVHWGNTEAMATAEVGGCNIWINPDQWARHTPARRCDTIVHEYGHLLGQGHTEDWTVMDPLRTTIVPECKSPKGARFTPERLPRRYRGRYR